MVSKGKGFWAVGILLACLFWPARVQGETPWAWTFHRPSNVEKSNVEKEEIWVGCARVDTGELLNCPVELEQRFDLSDAPDWQHLRWTGGHEGGHLPRTGPTALGTLTCDRLQRSQDGNRCFGFSDNREPNKVVKVMPEASGIIRFSGRVKKPLECPECEWVPDATWRLDPNDPSQVRLEAAFWVSVDGLVELPDSDLWVKNSNSPGHIWDGKLQVFYATPEMIDKLSRLAEAYREEYKNRYGVPDAKISFNDLSLPYGGLFDISNNWQPEHKLHRLGRSADVNTRDAAQVKKHLIDELASKFGLKDLHPSGPEDPCSHCIHLEMLPVKK